MAEKLNFTCGSSLLDLSGFSGFASRLDIAPRVPHIRFTFLPFNNQTNCPFFVMTLDPRWSCSPVGRLLTFTCTTAYMMPFVDSIYRLVTPGSSCHRSCGLSATISQGNHFVLNQQPLTNVGCWWSSEGSNRSKSKRCLRTSLAKRAASLIQILTSRLKFVFDTFVMSTLSCQVGYAPQYLHHTWWVCRFVNKKSAWSSICSYCTQSREIVRLFHVELP